MKKICYVVTISTTIKSFFIPQLKYLASKGFSVTVICSYDDTLQDLLGDSIQYIPLQIPRGISIIQSIRATQKLKRIFANEKFDLVQYSTPNAALYASIAAKQAKITSRNYHLMGFRFLGAKGIGRFILKNAEKICCANSTSIECVSMSNLEFGVNESIFRREKACVVWNGSTGGVDLQRFDHSMRAQWRKQLRDSLGYDDNDFIFGYVGRITQDKGINELLKAFFGIENCKLFLIGSTENRNSLDKKTLAQARLTDSILFHESVEDIERYYAMIDVLVFPSYREGFGNVVIEAAAMETPSIISNIPGPIDAVERNITALTVPPKDWMSLFKAMKQMTELDVNKMGKKAFQFVSTSFDSTILCEKIRERKSALVGTDTEYKDKNI